jgi:hypothetical protein
MVRTKIEISYNQLGRIEDLDELAAILFPGNRNQQKIFLAIFIELKWADNQFLTALEPIADKYAMSHRVLEIVRAKLRRLGLVDHVSRFNKKHGYREGWIFSSKFGNSLEQLSQLVLRLREKKNPLQERKDRDALNYV